MIKTKDTPDAPTKVLTKADAPQHSIRELSTMNPVKEAKKKGSAVRIFQKRQQTLRMDIVLDKETTIWADVKYAIVSDVLLAAVQREATARDVNANYVLFEKVIEKWSFTATIEEINEAFEEYFVFKVISEWEIANKKYEDDLYQWELDEEGCQTEEEKAELRRKPSDVGEKPEENELRKDYRKNRARTPDDLCLYEPEEGEEIDPNDPPLYHVPPRAETIASMFPSFGGYDFSNIIWKEIIARLSPTMLSGDKM